MRAFSLACDRCWCCEHARRRAAGSTLGRSRAAAPPARARSFADASSSPSSLLPDPVRRPPYRPLSPSFPLSPSVRIPVAPQDMTDTPTRDRPQVDTAAAAVAPSTPASSSSSTRPNQHRSRSSFSGTSSDGLTSPKAHHYSASRPSPPTCPVWRKAAVADALALARAAADPHPYGAITTSSGNLTRSNSVPSSMSWVSTHKPSRCALWLLLPRS